MQSALFDSFRAPPIPTQERELPPFFRELDALVANGQARFRNCFTGRHYRIEVETREGEQGGNAETHTFISDYPYHPPEVKK